jgi:hypothetical protein
MGGEGTGLPHSLRRGLDPPFETLARFVPTNESALRSCSIVDRGTRAIRWGSSESAIKMRHIAQFAPEPASAGRATPQSARNEPVRQAQAIFAFFRHARCLASRATLPLPAFEMRRRSLFSSLPLASSKFLAGTLRWGGYCVFIFRQSQRASNARAIRGCKTATPANFRDRA